MSARRRAAPRLQSAVLRDVSVEVPLAAAVYVCSSAKTEEKTVAVTGLWGVWSGKTKIES